jgi:DNA-binding transcriptional ArsR family regulator
VRAVAGKGLRHRLLAASQHPRMRTCQALAHPVRLRLVRTLARSSHTTSELADAWDLTPPEVSRHLAVLRRAGLLTAERRGRYVYYAVDLPALTALGTDLLAVVLR